MRYQLSIDIYQTHDLNGEPAPQQFREVLEHKLGVPESEMFRRCLSPLRPSLIVPLGTADPYATDSSKSYHYSDPLRGSGWLRVNFFEQHTGYRVDELVKMEEIKRTVGPDPRRIVQDINQGLFLFIRAASPWVQIAMGLFLCVFVPLIMLVIRNPYTAGSRGPDDTSLVVVTTVFMVLFMALGAFVGWVGASRLSWWMKARSHAIAEQRELLAQRGIRSKLPIEMNLGVWIR